MHLTQYTSRAVATLALVCALLINAQPVYAQVPSPVVEVGPALVTQNLTLVESGISAVKNAAIVTKEYILNTLAWEVANLAIESITKSTVNWINSGFQGSPAFVTDLNENLSGVSDTVAARFFDELSSQRIKTSPFQDKVLDAVRLGYYLRTSPDSFYTRNPYTLDRVSANDAAFLKGDFSQGGWDAWFETVNNPNNNRYGAEMLANQALEDAVSSATGARLQELSWNRGFLQWCGDEISVEADAAEAESLEQEDQCVGKQTRTPGSVISEQLNDALGSGMERLIVADDFNEIIGALLNQLAAQVLGGGSGGGLTGVSRPSSGGGSSFLDTASQGSGANIASSFSATISRQTDQVLTFQKNWEKIRDAANAALAKCGTTGNASAQQVLDTAATRLVRAANALAALTKLQADITAANTAGGNQSNALSAVSSAYGELINSNTLPTPEEISEAQIQSKDTGSANPGSLYSQMTRISNSSCNSAGE